MPKRRPIFEFTGLSRFLGSSSSESSYHYRAGRTDESPRRPLFSLSSRHQSSRRYHRGSRKHRRRRKRHKHHYSRRAQYDADQRYRRGRYENRLHDQYRSQNARALSFAEDELREEVLGSPSAHSSRSSSHRTSMRQGRRRLKSPPPFDPHTRNQYPSPSPEYPQGARLSPEYERDARRKPGLPTGYPDDYNPAERAVDPRLEHSFNPSGLPEDDDDEGAYERSFQRHPSGHVRRHTSHKRHRHRRHKGILTRRRRKRHHRRESSDDDSGGEESGSEEPERDETGNLIESATHSERIKIGGRKKKKGKDDGKKKKGKKRGIAKIVALALGALAVGLIAKKIIARRKRKKAKQDAEAATAQQEAADPYAASMGQPMSTTNRLQLPVPKASFSVKVPETEAFIVERGGRYNRRLGPGSNILIPFVDRVAFRFSLKEINTALPGQQCYTRENVSVMASALIFAKVEDAVAAAYGVDDPHGSLMLLAQTCMRKEIARLDLEHLLQDRDGLGDRILGSINRASRPWGVRCTRFEVRDLIIPDEMRTALERQAEVERQVRANVLASQGDREAMKNRADGEMHAQMRMSQARQIDAVNQAIGEAHAISERGEAIAGAMRDVAEVLEEPGGEKAMQMRIAEQYIHSYANAAKNQDHMPPPPNPADMAEAWSNVMEVLNTGPGGLRNFEQPGSTVANPYVRQGSSSNKPVPALEQQDESHSQSGDGTRPLPTASSGPSPGASSHQPSESHHGTSQVQVEVPSQSIPGNGSSLHHSVPSPHGGSNLSNAAPLVQTPVGAHAQSSARQYRGPDYPQASPVPNQ